jgi:hypothetical protein
MKYLVLGVWAGQDSPFTLSREMELGFDEPEDRAASIIELMANEGIGRESLWEVFVFKSAQNYGDAPEQVAYWNLDDGLFGEQEDEEDEEEGPEEEDDQG